MRGALGTGKGEGGLRAGRIVAGACVFELGGSTGLIGIEKLERGR